MPLIAPEALGKHLEVIGEALSARLESRYGERAFAVLVETGVVPKEVAEHLTATGTPPERAGDTCWPLALYNDCLTIITLPRLLTQDMTSWDGLERIRPFLTRAASFYATLHPRFVPYRSLSKDKLPGFLSLYCGGTDCFTFASRSTRFLGLRLCSHVLKQLRDPSLLDRFHDDVLMSLWQYATADVTSALAGPTLIDWRQFTARLR